MDAAKKNQNKKHKILNIVSWTVVGIFLACALFVMITTLVMKANGSSFSINGNEIRLVLTESMQWSDKTPESVKNYEIKNIDKNNAVFIKKLPTNEEEKAKAINEYKVGDVLTFNYYTGGEVVSVTHRVAYKTEYGNGYIFTMQGDNYESGEPGKQFIYTATDKYNPEPNNTITGKVYKVDPALGSFLTVITNKVFVGCVVVLPCAVIIVYEIIRIVKVVKEDKESKKPITDSGDTNVIDLEEKAKAQQEEIARLKEELEKAKKENNKN